LQQRALSINAIEGQTIPESATEDNPGVEKGRRWRSESPGFFLETGQWSGRLPHGKTDPPDGRDLSGKAKGKGIWL